ncbi:MAG: hypothetical protein V4691_06850 [Pseudomonadota bacterium]
MQMPVIVINNVFGMPVPMMMPQLPQIQSAPLGSMLSVFNNNVFNPSNINNVSGQQQAQDSASSGHSAYNRIFGPQANAQNAVPQVPTAGPAQPSISNDPFNAGYTFGRMDTNGDRVISMDEYKAFNGMNGPSLPSAQPSPGLPGSPQQGDPGMPPAGQQGLPQQPGSTSPPAGLPQNPATQGAPSTMPPAGNQNPAASQADPQSPLPQQQNPASSQANPQPGANPAASAPDASDPQKQAVIDAIKNKIAEEKAKADGNKNNDQKAENKPDDKKVDDKKADENKQADDKKADEKKAEDKKDGKKPSELQQLWAKADEADGKADRHINLKALIKKADTSGGAKEGEGDGKLSEEEYKNFAAMLGLKLSYASFKEDGISAKTLIDKIKSADKNHDGQVTEEEFEALNAGATEEEKPKDDDIVIDVDKNDAVSKDESKDDATKDSKPDDAVTSSAPGFLSINTNKLNGIRPDELEIFLGKSKHVKDGKFSKEALNKMFGDYGWDKSKLGKPVLDDLTADGSEKTVKQVSDKMFEKLDRDPEKTTAGTSGLIRAEMGDLVKPAKKKRAPQGEQD